MRQRWLRLHLSVAACGGIRYSPPKNGTKFKRLFHIGTIISEVVIPTTAGCAKSIFISAHTLEANLRQCAPRDKCGKARFRLRQALLHNYLQARVHKGVYIGRTLQSFKSEVMALPTAACLSCPRRHGSIRLARYYLAFGIGDYGVLQKR